MGGAPAIPINSGRDVDGFREGLNPSYELPDCLTGKSAMMLSSPRAKNIPLSPSGKSVI